MLNNVILAHIRNKISTSGPQGPQGADGAQGPAGQDGITHTWLTLGSNATNSTVTLAPVSGMSFNAEANSKYLVRLYGAYQSAALTTGIAVALDIPAGGTVIGMAGTRTSAIAVGGIEQVADNATTGATTGVRAISTNTPIEAWWIVQTTSSGTVQLTLRSEIAASLVTLMTGTLMSYEKVA